MVFTINAGRQVSILVVCWSLLARGVRERSAEGSFSARTMSGSAGLRQGRKRPRRTASAAARSPTHCQACYLIRAILAAFVVVLVDPNITSCDGRSACHLFAAAVPLGIPTTYEDAPARPTENKTKVLLPFDDNAADGGGLDLLTDLIDEDGDDSILSSGGLVFDLHVEASTTAPSSSSSLSSSPPRRELVLLLEAAGHLRNGRVCGLLGPSGSGKTTLLASLLQGSTLDYGRGTATTSGGLRRQGRIGRYHHRRGDPARVSIPRHGNRPSASPGMAWQPLHPSQVAYLQQRDDFFELLTVRETLQLAAFLELPHVSESQRDLKVNDLLERLGLAAVADQRIGSSASDSRGGGGSSDGRLSGGERRRLSVALELVTEKQLVVADEPTTGLDSALSLQVLRLLKQLALWNDIPCVISLHQPRSSIFNDYLDDVLLLAPGGRLCYAGTTAGALAYFAGLGHPVPPATNPAEFLVDLVSVDADNRTQAALDRDRIDVLARAFRTTQRRERNERQRRTAPPSLAPMPQAATVPVMWNPSLEDTVVHAPNGPSPWSVVRRWAALWRRSWRQNSRNRTVNLFRAMASAGNAVLLAQIFPTVRGTVIRANSVADRVALLSFGAINQCMMAYVKTAELFSRERPVVHRERMRHQYSALEYLLAKVGGELVLDACFASIFATVLKACSGVRIPWDKLTGAFSLLTVAGASLGFAVGSWAPSEQLANTAGIPIVVVLMVVGVINPSGVDPSKPKPAVVRILKRLSPFASCIEALCLGEYPGMTFAAERGGWFRRASNFPRMGGLALVRNGDQVIQALGLNGVTYEGAMKHLALLCAGNFVVSWLGLLFHQRTSPGKKSKQGRPSRSTARSTPRPSEMLHSRDPAGTGPVALHRGARR